LEVLKLERRCRDFSELSLQGGAFSVPSELNVGDLVALLIHREDGRPLFRAFAVVTRFLPGAEPPGGRAWVAFTQLVPEGRQRGGSGAEGLPTEDTLARLWHPPAVETEETGRTEPPPRAAPAAGDAAHPPPGHGSAPANTSAASTPAPPLPAIREPELVRPEASAQAYSQAAPDEERPAARHAASGSAHRAMPPKPPSPHTKQVQTTATTPASRPRVTGARHLGRWLAVLVVAAVVAGAALLLWRPWDRRPANRADKPTTSVPAPGSTSSAAAPLKEEPVPPQAATASTAPVPTEAPSAVSRQPSTAPESSTAAIPSTAASSTAAGAADEPSSMIEQWADAWSRRDADQYLSFYAKGFRPANGANRSEWERERRSRLADPEFIGVWVRLLVIDRTGQDRAVASFRQLHRSKAGLRATAKRLDLVMEAGRWRIAAETVR